MRTTTVRAIPLVIASLLAIAAAIILGVKSAGAPSSQEDGAGRPPSPSARP